MTANPPTGYTPWLWLLLGLFVVRIIAQPVALLMDAWFLPPFDSWHGGVLPYPMLVATQFLILAWLARTTWRFTRGEVVPHHRFGIWLLALGSVYFAVMLARLLLGATALTGHRWFSAFLPTLFHLVLAAYLLVYGHFHFRYGSNGRHGRRG